MYSPDEHTFPQTPGVYLMKNAKGRIIYVGKAKNLRKRILSYFRSPDRLTAKTRALVGRIKTIETLSTATEKEALLVEESLIKKHRPRYNVVLRDDKRYILFKLDKNSRYPRLSLTRRVARDGSVYYGPFTSAQAARETLKVINRVFPLRKCKDSVFKNRVRPCLYLHIGQCAGPCTQDVDPDHYALYVRQVEQLLSGRSTELVRALEKDMAAHSERLEFEKAAAIRDQIKAIERTVERQAVVLHDGRDLDVIALAELPTGLSLVVLFIRQGRLLDRKAFFWPNLTLEEGPEVVESFLGQFYTPTSFIPPRLILPVDIDSQPLVELLAERRQGPVRLGRPATREEKQLMDIGRTNAVEAARSRQETSPGDLLAQALALDAEPERIECVDISHLGGTTMRAGLVVFEHAKPLKDAYRTYAFPELEGSGDDYQAMAAWAKRRVQAGPPWPDLLLIDGGRGQLAAVERALLDAGGPPELEIAAIAKGSHQANELNDRIFRPNRKNPLPLKPGSPPLLFLQHIRDTAHNYVLGRQRQGRAKTALASELMHLQGIGPKTARLLWDHFPSIEAMTKASLQDLQAIPGLGLRRAQSVHKALAALTTDRA